MPPNEEGCTELTREKAFCKYTVSGETREIPAEEWRKMRVGRISFTAKGFGSFVNFIERACEITGRCTQEEKAELEQASQLMREYLNEHHINLR